MHQSPRLLGTTAGRRNFGSERAKPTTAPTTAGPPQPNTPHHDKSGAALDCLIIALEEEWRLGLRIRTPWESPQEIDTSKLSERVYGLIKRLFFSARPALDAALNNFKELAQGFDHSKRLELLHGILKSKTESPISRAVTPLNNPPKTLGSVQISRQGARPRGLFDNYRSGPHRSPSHDSRHTALLDPGSPTDVDEEDYFTPPSPTRSTASAQRREASQLNPRKRPPDDSGKPESSSKLTKTSQGKQSNERFYIHQDPAVANSFKKPTLEMARSFNQDEYDAFAPSSSVNTSYINESLFSSQESRVITTANTSFATDISGDEPPANWRQRKSTTSLESLGDTEVAGAFSKAERAILELQKQREADRISSQGASRESNSTYGSLDEDLLLYAANGTIRNRSPPLNSSENVKAQTLQPDDGRITHHLHVDTPHSKTPTLTQSDTKDSASRVAWYIRDIPSSNLFADDMPRESVTCPYFLTFIASRIASANSVPLANIMRNLDIPGAHDSPSLFWSRIGEHLRTHPRESKHVWTAAKRSFEGYTFKGNVVFGRSGSVFKLNLLPIETEKSCLLQRMFGSDRFLYLTFPSFRGSTERFTGDQMPLIEAQWKLWLNQSHSFLARKWRVFHVESLTKKSTSRKKEDNVAGMRVILFATEGVGIDRPISVGEMINEFFPFSRNAFQNFCKAFARLDLALSRTTPTLVFKPSQIRRIPDILADGTPEAWEFDDKRLDWTEHYDKRPVMNDGCARVSVGAVLLICQVLRDTAGFEGPVPSAFQGRIGGAKGMWMISAEPHTRDPAHLDIWIEVSDSQLKFEPPPEDDDDYSYSPHRLTFNFLKHSFVNGSSDLHISYIPILVDRGVKRDVIADLIISRLDEEREQLLEMLDDPVRLHNWISKQEYSTSALGILQWQAALPVNTGERAKLLLRAGFHPGQSAFLAKILKAFVGHRQRRMEEKLRAPLGKSTYLLGLADPLGVLKPGEVHVQFSNPFVDEYGQNTYRNLDGEEVLVSRQPACRRSDIQKVRAVAHPKLLHLVDVIVFPSRGQYPAAGKLQGGDYDGDTFWVCWEPALVAPFLNAPAPLNELEPGKYGIKKDSRRLIDIMDPHDLTTVEYLLKEVLEFRLARSLLGRVTNLGEHVSYKENRIHSAKLNAIYDVHDLLVDAAKQAYKFTDKDFIQLVKYQLRCGNPRAPAYKEAMEKIASSKAKGDEVHDVAKSFKYNRNNVIDFLYFEILRRHNTQTRQALKDALPKEEEDDPDLRVPFLQLKESDDQVLAAEISDLLTGIKKILNEWNGSFNPDSELDGEQLNKVVDSCYTKFRSLLPSPVNATHPQIAPLLRQYFGPKHPTLWETIRASALYTMHSKKLAFVWNMAGRDLARLKAATNSDTYHIVPAIFADLKPKPNKIVKLDEEDYDTIDEIEYVLARYR